MTTMLQRLLSHPHTPVFDKDPHAELALRVRHPNGAKWEVADNVLTLTAGSAAPVTFDLVEHTVGSLAAAMTSAGFEVVYTSESWITRPALALIEGKGDEAQSNGDHIKAFTSLLWALYTGYAGELREAEYQIGQALRQMIIYQAEGEWLDVWGTLYGIERAGKTDAAYAPHIPEEAFRLRVNALGIEKAIYDQTGFDVRIVEPWKEVFRLDESLLSGPHKFYDGERYGYHLIQPTSNEQVDWDVVLPIIQRNKPAGVIVLGQMERRIAWLDASGGISLAAGCSLESGQVNKYEDRPILDYSLFLSDNESLVQNHAALYRVEQMYSSSVIVPSQPWDGLEWGPESWAMAYRVTGKASQDYEVFYLSIDYRSQPWTVNRTWVTANDTWSGMSPIIGSAYTEDVAEMDFSADQNSAYATLISQ